MSELLVKKIIFGDDSSQQTAGDRSFRNVVVNGDMAVDQEFAGASTPVTAAAALKYVLDQWYAYCTGANISGQQVAGPIANTFRYKLTGAASNTGAWFGQRMEAVNTAYLAGSTATIQALLSSVGLTQVTWTLYYATTKDTFGSVASPTRTQIATGNFTINSTEAKYEAQVTIPSAATTGLELVISCGSLISGQTLTIGDVQLEKAGAASEFERVPFDEQLRRCQRYWEKSYNYLDVPGAVTKEGSCLVRNTVNGAIQAFFSTTFSVRKRVPPVVVWHSPYNGLAARVFDANLGNANLNVTGQSNDYKIGESSPGGVLLSTGIANDHVITGHWVANARL